MEVSVVIRDIQTLLDMEPVSDQGAVADTFGEEQRKDEQLHQVIHFLNTGQFPQTRLVHAMAFPMLDQKSELIATLRTILWSA